MMERTNVPDTDRAGSSGTPADIVALVSMSLKKERARAALSLTELAKRAGIAKSTLSQLENGTGNPSLETLWALGTALGIPLSRLIDPPRSDVQVIRAGEGAVLHAERDPYAAVMLASSPQGARRDIYLITIGLNAVRHAEAHTTGSIEHILVMSGAVRCGPVGQTVDLNPRDYAVFPGDVPHSYEGLAEDTALAMVMEHTSR